MCMRMRALAQSQVPVPSTRLFPLSGRHKVAYTATASGDYEVVVSVAQGHGLHATFYSDTELETSVLSERRDTIDFDQVSEPVLGGDTSFSVRWAGLLKMKGEHDYASPLSDEVFTFEAGVAESDERVKLWVDNSLIIDRWHTYTDLEDITFSATIALKRPYYYDLKLEYKQDGGNLAKVSLRYKCGLAGADCSKSTTTIISSSNLFLAEDVKASPMPLTVHPAQTCADTSTAHGMLLSSGTAGVSDTFIITGRCAFSVYHVHMLLFENDTCAHVQQTTSSVMIATEAKIAGTCEACRFPSGMSWSLPVQRACRVTASPVPTLCAGPSLTMAMALTLQQCRASRRGRTKFSQSLLCQGAPLQLTIPLLLTST